MLEILAKTTGSPFKKLSQFRLEFYKKYGGKFACRTREVENSVETVEFHPESGRTNLIFEHFPPGFQHVEKFEPDYRLYSLLNVENFCIRQTLRRMPGYAIL